jgi:hypothetical protein
MRSPLLPERLVIISQAADSSTDPAQALPEL